MREASAKPKALAIPIGNCILDLKHPSTPASNRGGRRLMTQQQVIPISSEQWGAMLYYQ
ncbi:hypothetical protein [Microcoleus sp. FACHB-831]|uniref:hypothetical protein n=1 Tax=Microcoleus sp. FACHB-831 TaxID=2692827 RepID=UPI0016880C50|nr:hypothetical protein [Microcoleus sp. FACHB-831]